MKPSPACNSVRAAQHADDGADARRRLLALLPGLSAALAAAVADDARAQDAAKVQPQAYRVAFENDKLRVLEFRSKPGLAVCGNGMHSHPAHLTIALTAAKVRVKTPDGKSFTPENQAGDVFWSDAETHEVENIGGKDVRALIVELKEPKASVKKA